MFAYHIDNKFYPTPFNVFLVSLMIAAGANLSNQQSVIFSNLVNNLDLIFLLSFISHASRYFDFHCVCQDIIFPLCY